MLKYNLAIQLTMKYGMNSRPTSSLRHINEINHKRGITHFEKFFEALHVLAKKLFERKLTFCLWRKVYMLLIYKSKNKYMPPYYFLLYIQYDFM